MPIERAVPSIWRAAASTSFALRSLILMAAISRIWSLETRPTVSRFVVEAPFSMPAALRRRSAAGGVLRMNVNERSSKIVIWAGITWPALSAVRSLYDFVNSTMLMPCGPRAVPTGGAGVALPAGSWRVRTMRIFLATVGTNPFWSFLELLDLQEVQLDRRLAAEDAHEDLDLVPLRVDLVDRADELGERPIGDPDALALREGDAELGCLDTHVPQDLLDLVLVERDRLTPNAWDVRPTDEARHARRVPDDEPAVRLEDHLDEDVARVDLLLDGVALALADLDLILHRDEDLEDLVLHAHRLDAVLEVGLDLVLVARVRMDDVPALVRCLGRLGRRGFHHHPALCASSETSWAKTASRTVM